MKETMDGHTEFEQIKPHEFEAFSPAKRRDLATSGWSDNGRASRKWYMNRWPFWTA